MKQASSVHRPLLHIIESLCLCIWLLLMHSHLASGNCKAAKAAKLQRRLVFQGILPPWQPLITPSISHIPPAVSVSQGVRKGAEEYVDYQAKI